MNKAACNLAGFSRLNQRIEASKELQATGFLCCLCSLFLLLALGGRGWLFYLLYGLFSAASFFFWRKLTREL